MALLSDIPREIIDHILGFVPRDDFTNLCLVNKSLRQSVEPFLYSTIEMKWEYNHIPSIIPLLRTLIQRPDLFIFIDRVCLDGDYFADDPEHPSLDTSNVPFAQFIDAIKKTEVPYTGLWIDRLRSGGMDAFAGLLVANLSTISSLYITHNFISGDDILGKILLSKVYGQLPAFGRLKEIIYVKRMDRQIWERNEIFPHTISLFYLPTTLRHINVSISNPEIFQWPVEEPNLDHITSLDIQWLVEPYMAKILALTRNLKSFCWRWIYHDHPDEELESTTLDFDKIISILSYVKATLERFRFTMEIGDDEYDRPPGDMILLGSFNSLIDFNQLKYLSIPLVCLAGFGPEPVPLEQSVPTSIEVIHLRSQDVHHFGTRPDWLYDIGYRNRHEIVSQMVRSLAKTHLRLRRATVFGEAAYP